LIVFAKQKLVILENTKTATSSFEFFLEKNKLHVNSRPKGESVDADAAWALLADPLYFYNNFNNKNSEKAFFVDKHISYKKYIKNYKSYIDSYETFSLIREPLDWFMSWYKMTQDDNRDWNELEVRGLSFENFIENYIQKEWYVQTDFLLPEQENDPPIDHLFQYEQLPLAIDFLQNRLGFDINLEQVNVSHRINPVVSNDTIEKFKITFAKEYNLWNSARRNAFN